jgi:hypothetical protein
MPDRKVLLTGATGYVASQLVPTFRENYEMTLVDVKETDREGRQVAGVAISDLSGPDLGEYAHLFQGQDSVVHLAYKRRRGTPLDDFYDEQVNVAMAYNVFRSAYDAGARRVVMASSNHAADWYEHSLIHARKLENLDPYKLPLSDNFYGWAKATYEHIGFLFASGVFGRKMDVVMVRIGAPREIRVEDFPGDPETYKRDLGAYISPRDLTHLFTKALEAPSIENEHGIPWLVVYGISDNARSFWSLTSARKYLDYQPEDDSEVKYADDIRAFLTSQGGLGGPGRVG